MGQSRSALVLRSVCGAETTGGPETPDVEDKPRLTELPDEQQLTSPLVSADSQTSVSNGHVPVTDNNNSKNDAADGSDAESDSHPNRDVIKNNGSDVMLQHRAVTDLKMMHGVGRQWNSRSLQPRHVR